MCIIVNINIIIMINISYINNYCFLLNQVSVFIKVQKAIQFDKNAVF